MSGCLFGRQVESYEMGDVGPSGLLPRRFRQGFELQMRPERAG